MSNKGSSSRDGFKGGRGRGGFGPHGGMNFEKPKNFKTTFIKLLKYLKPNKLQLISVFIFAIISTVFMVFGPKIMGKATTKLFEGMIMKYNKVPGAKIDFDYILNIVLILIMLYVISSIFSYLQQFIMAKVSQRTVYKMRKDVNEKLNKLPLKYFDKKTHGEIMSRVTNDIDNISTTLQQSLTQIITAICTIIGISIMMLTISPYLTLLTLATLPVAMFVTVLIAKQSQKYFKEQQKELGILNGHVEEMYTGHKIVKAYGYEKKSNEKFEIVNKRLYKASWKAQFVSGIIFPMVASINNISYVIICIVGGRMVISGTITIGDIQAFIQYSRQFMQPVVQTANIANVIQSTVASAERVFEILEEEEEISDENNIVYEEKLKGNVSFKNINFGYDKDKVIIENMDINVKAGQTIAIVGPTGAGKTTLVNLLMRFYDVDSGKILIDGVDIKELKRDSLRNMFGMVLQDTWLFNGTIKDNIAYGCEGATDEEVIKAAETAHADHFIRTLPDGYNMLLNEEANNISQGQKQLLTIARAVLKDPSILILDEATSSVDTRTEIFIQKAMKKLMKGRTNFVIAHRLSTIKESDLILVMDDGKVIETGSHQELLKLNGFYADLYNSQFTSSNDNFEEQVG